MLLNADWLVSEEFKNYLVTNLTLRNYILSKCRNENINCHHMSYKYFYYSGIDYQQLIKSQKAVISAFKYVANDILVI